MIEGVVFALALALVKRSGGHFDVAFLSGC